MKVGEASGDVRKKVLQTEAQEKLLRGLLKGEFDNAKKDLQREMSAIKDEDKKQ